MATTSNISNSDFMSGNYNLTPGGNPNATVSNAGSISVAAAGLAALVAPQVVNSGTITAKLGKVALASGDSYKLDLYGDGLINLGISDSVAKQLVATRGTIHADGGQVQLTVAAASNPVSGVINMSGIIQARTLGDLTGNVTLYAQGSNAVPGNIAADKGQKTGSSTVLVSDTIDASGQGVGETGGSIGVLGDDVGILTGASIDASGQAGGGSINIGGDFHGQGTTPTALASLVQNGAAINSDALAAGNGGSVAVWSDDYTSFTGFISARGASQSGNGGYVETSGKQILTTNGLVDASALQGHADAWLMDPEDVNITNSDSDITGNPNFVPGGTQAAANLNAADIDTALNAGTDVTVTTGGDAQSGPNGGSITLSAPISATTGSGGVTGSLTLSSYNNIILNQGITLGGVGVTGGNLILDADNHNNGSGYIWDGGAITTNGGNITMDGGSGTITAGSGFAYGNSGYGIGVLINEVDHNAGDGNTIINGEGYNSAGNSNEGINLTPYGGHGSITTSGSGTIALTGIDQGTGNSYEDYGVMTTGAISTANGNLTITGTGGGAGSGFENFGVWIFGTTIETTGSGNLSVTGSGGDAGGSGGNNYGIRVDDANGIQTTGNGAMTLIGTGGGDSGYNNIGISVDPGASITGGGGTMTIIGTGGNGSSDWNIGVYGDGGSITNAGGGAITITGTGQGTVSSGADYGIELLMAV